MNLVTRNVARAANLSDRGALEVGLKADLVALEDGTFPRVRGTWRSGQLLFTDGVLLPHLGQAVPSKASAKFL